MPVSSAETRFPCDGTLIHQRPQQAYAPCCVTSNLPCCNVFFGAPCSDYFFSFHSLSMNERIALDLYVVVKCAWFAWHTQNYVIGRRKKRNFLSASQFLCTFPLTWVNDVQLLIHFRYGWRSVDADLVQWCHLPDARFQLRNQLHIIFI